MVARRTIRARRRRGNILLITLGTAMLATILCLSALTVVRIENLSTRGEDQARRCAAAARGIAEVAYHRMRTSATWRLDYESGEWTQVDAVPGGIGGFALVDEADGDLADDAQDPLRLYVVVRIDDARRAYSCLLEPDPNPNLLFNEGFENGTAGWGDLDVCRLDVDTSDPYDGSAHCTVTDRKEWWSGPRQALDVDRLVNGEVYYVEAWVRIPSDTEWVKITVMLQAAWSGTDYVSTSSETVGGSWKQIRGMLPLSWSGELTAAQFYVETPGSRRSFHVDNCIIRLVEVQPTLQPVPGSWRQETLSSVPDLP